MANAPGARHSNQAGLTAVQDTGPGLGVALFQAAKTQLSDAAPPQTLSKVFDALLHNDAVLPSTPPLNYQSLFDRYETLQNAQSLSSKLQRNLLFHMSPRHVFAGTGRAATETFSKSIDANEHGQSFIADPPVGKEFRFILPVLMADDAGFEVTLRNGGTGTVTATASAPIDSSTSGKNIVANADRPVFRWNGKNWTTGEENRLDFHATLSAISQFPDLQRRLGLLVDIELPLSLAELSAHPDKQIRVDVIGLQDAIAPWTAFAVEPNRELFTAASSPGSLCPLERGLLRSTTQHAVYEFDTDAAALQLPPILAELQRAKNSQTLGVIDADTLQDVSPRLRDAGISVHDNAMEARLREQLARAEELRELVSTIGGWPDDRALYAQDLLQGFRADVARLTDKGKAWHSLHGREVQCWVGTIAFQADAPASLQFRDEGWLDTSAQQSGPENMYKVSSAIARWMGWGFSAPQPGKVIADDATVTTPHSMPKADGVPLRISARRLDNSLVTRRFGNRYWLRLRAVDLAGYSIPVETTVDDPASTFFLSDTDGGLMPLGRAEPVSPPALVPKQPVAPPGTNALLAIRTTDNDRADDAEWLILPPQVSQNFAELHGVFDRFPRTREGAIALRRLLASLQGAPPKWSEKVTDWETRGFDKAWLREHLKLGRLRLPYHPDPLSRSCVIEGTSTYEGRVEREFAPKTTDPIEAHLVRVVTLRLKRGRFEKWTGGDDTIEVTLPPGASKVVTLRSGIGAADSKYFALLNLEPQESNRLAARARIEGLPGITPRQSITLVHAVQRPCLPEGRDDIGYASVNIERRRHVPDGQLAARVNVDVPSTGKIAVAVDWTDIVDDPALPDWIEVSQRLEPFEAAIPPGAISPVSIGGTVRFPDTKHHVVRVGGTGWTRYPEHFADIVGPPALMLTRPVTATECVLPASASPAKPLPYYIVPLSWVQELDETAGRKTKIHRRNGLRIYMHRGWFSSGNGERLGIVLLPSDAQAERPLLDGLLTEWGADPVWKGAEIFEKPTIKHLACNCGEADVIRKGQLRVRLPQAVLEANATPAAAAYETELVDLVTLPVKLDQAKGLLFADLTVDAGLSYMPFIRFGLVRYQPNALPEERLSEVERTTFCQVMPNRTVSVQRLGRHEWRVTVVGPQVQNHPHNRLRFTVAVRVRHDSRAPGWYTLPGTQVELKPKTVDGYDGQWEGIVSATNSARNVGIVVQEEQLIHGTASVLRVWVETVAAP